MSCLGPGQRGAGLPVPVQSSTTDLRTALVRGSRAPCCCAGQEHTAGSFQLAASRAGCHFVALRCPAVPHNAVQTEQGLPESQVSRTVRVSSALLEGAGVMLAVRLQRQHRLRAQDAPYQSVYQDGKRPASHIGLLENIFVVLSVAIVAICTQWQQQQGLPTQVRPAASSCCAQAPTCSRGCLARASPRWAAASSASSWRRCSAAAACWAARRASSSAAIRACSCSMRRNALYHCGRVAKLSLNSLCDFIRRCRRSSALDWTSTGPLLT